MPAYICTAWCALNLCQGEKISGASILRDRGVVGREPGRWWHRLVALNCGEVCNRKRVSTLSIVIDKRLKTGKIHVAKSSMLQRRFSIPDRQTCTPRYGRPSGHQMGWRRLVRCIRQVGEELGWASAAERMTKRWSADGLTMLFLRAHNHRKADEEPATAGSGLKSRGRSNPGVAGSQITCLVLDGTEGRLHGADLAVSGRRREEDMRRQRRAVMRALGGSDKVGRRKLLWFGKVACGGLWPGWLTSDEA